MKTPDERALLERARCFDLQALEEIYDRFSPGLYVYAVRLLGNPCQAEDCVAETFSRLLQGLKAGRGPQEYLQAYLYRIAQNWITDQYRRQPPPPLSLEDGLPLAGEERTDQAAAEHWQAEQVRAALRRLTSDQRQVLTLKFYEGWDNEAVARTVQKPVGAVKSLQHRALDALRRMLSSAEEAV